MSEDIVLVRKLPDWLADLSKIGKEFSIFRCEYERVVMGYSIEGDGWSPNVEADRVSLIHLNDTRLQQRGELVAELRSGLKVQKP